MARAVAKTGFTMVHDDVRDHPDLSLLAVNIVSYMERRALDGRWSGGMQMLADLFTSSKSQVRREMVTLEAAGFIKGERCKVGQRFSYRMLRLHDKACHPGTVGKTESVPPRHGPCPPGTLACHPGTRKRLRPLETRENTLSQTRTAEKSRSAVAPELYESVVTLFYPSGVLDAQIEEVRQYTAQLATLGATPDEVPRRHRRWSELGHTYACTLATLIRHWDVLAPPPPPAPNPYDPYDGRPPTVPPRDED